MLMVPGRCVKCPTMIVSGNSVSDLYEEIECRTSDGSTVVIGVCRRCSIEPADILGLSRVMTESLKASGFKGEVKITDITRRKTLPEVLKEVQSSHCFMCDDVLGPEYGIAHGRAVHVVCPKDKAGSTETLANVKLEPKFAKKVIRKGRAFSPAAERNDVQRQRKLASVGS